MGDDERETVIKLTAGLDRRALACCTFSGEGGSEIKSTLAALAARQCNRPELPCQGSSTRCAGGWQVHNLVLWLGLTKIKSYFNTLSGGICEESAGFGLIQAICGVTVLAHSHYVILVNRSQGLRRSH